MVNGSGWSQDDLPFRDYGHGTCINCGFLSERTPGVHFLDCYEVIVDDRASGRFAQAIHGRITWCLARGANLKREVDALAEDTPVEERIRAVIMKGRDCPRFYPYREGFSPQEHASERRMAEVERDRQVFEEGMEQRRREFEKRLERERRRFEIALFVVLTFIGVAVAIVGLVHGW